MTTCARCGISTCMMVLSSRDLRMDCNRTIQKIGSMQENAFKLFWSALKMGRQGTSLKPLRKIMGYRQTTLQGMGQHEDDFVDVGA
mmetsp:Transcript_2213/g.4821  ORF Transcript_2213/g.4821 Transcript_2213/m.4821 type:complete len:86 (-) Transcript_2213:459-716(-)